MYDYRLIEWLLPRNGKRSLDTLLYQEFGINTAEITDVQRVYFLSKLHQEGVLLKRIEEAGLTRILELESQLISVLFRMESEWVCFDQEHMHRIRERIRDDIARIEEEIYLIIGEHINLNSPKQLQRFFFETLGLKPIKKNKTGYSVDNDVLEEIAKTHDVARMILEYRGLSKLFSTYVEGLLSAVDLRDGCIHTTYDTLWTTTGRMSSNDPNLQNIPAWEGYAREIKECFIARPDHILMVADYSQIELRILAFLSQDSALMEAFIQGEDIHTRTARFLFENSLSYALSPDWTPTSEERRIAKTVNFGVIYGITGFGLAKTLGVSPWEAQKYIEAFYLRYPWVRVYYDTLLENAREQGYVETAFGRRRFIPWLRDANKTLRSIAEREAINMPIQGTAADMIKIAMVDIDAKIRELWLQGKMILQVHDELVFDVPRSEQEAFAQIVPEVMEWVLLREYANTDTPIVPIRVDTGWGENWAKAK